MPQNYFEGFVISFQLKLFHGKLYINNYILTLTMSEWDIIRDADESTIDDVNINSS